MNVSGITAKDNPMTPARDCHSISPVKHTYGGDGGIDQPLTAGFCQGDIANFQNGVFRSKLSKVLQVELLPR
jgi:hypothetical protein